MNDQNNTSQFSQVSLFAELSKKVSQTKSDKTESNIQQAMEKKNELFKGKVKTKIEDIVENVAEQEISLRKNNREQQFDQKRRLQKLPANQISKSLSDKLQINKDFYDECNKIEVENSQFEQYYSMFKSNSIEHQYKGLVGLRKLSSLSNILIKITSIFILDIAPPIQEIIDSGLIYDFLKLLDSPLEEIKFEALWCLTNIASSTGEHVNSIVSKDGIVKILPYIESDIIEIQSQVHIDLTLRLFGVLETLQVTP